MSIVFKTRSKLRGSSRYSLNYQHHLCSKFTSLGSNLATNQFLSGYSCPPFTPQRWPSILVIYYTFTPSHQLRSASLNLLSISSCSCLSWFSTHWPFSLAFPASSSQICRLLQCLQVQSKNSPFLWREHLDMIRLILRLEIILCLVML